MSWKGFSFPIKEGDKGIFSIKEDIQLIEGNIIQILMTRQGQRVMLPEFGSRILDFIHEPLTDVTCALIHHETIRAIERWEPRVILDKDNSYIMPHVQEARVEAVLRYFFKANNQYNSLSLEISERKGVIKWQS